MLPTFQALAVAFLALLPGAAFTFGYERVTGPFGIKASDRLVRFLVTSSVFLALFSGPGLLLYRGLVVSGRLRRGDVNALILELGALAYIVVPAFIGWLAGQLQRRQWKWVSWLGGGHPEPRAWDYLWQRPTGGVVRARLKSGTWLAGVYGRTDDGGNEIQSYASGYPEEQDLYLSRQLTVNPASGEFELDSHDAPLTVEGSGGLLLRWSEIEYLEYIELEDCERKGADGKQ